MELLNSLREKDYLDITADSLEEHCRRQSLQENGQRVICTVYLMSGRVDNEMIRPFRRFLLSWLGEREAEDGEEPKVCVGSSVQYLKSG